MGLNSNQTRERQLTGRLSFFVPTNITKLKHDTIDDQPVRVEVSIDSERLTHKAMLQEA